MPPQHRQQETGYSCGAACFAMLFGVPERAARRLCGTVRSGTDMSDIARAARKAGAFVREVDLDRPLAEVLWMLDAQSQRWPLLLSCTFRQNASDSRGRHRVHTRQHAIVLWRGQSYDPGEKGPIDAECIGHLGDRGIVVRSYLLVERPEDRRD